MHRNLVTLSPADFHGWRFNRRGTWLVRFTARWCPWCEAIMPVLVNLAAFRSDISVGSIDIEEDQGLTEHFRIASVPTLIVFQDGRELARSVGALSASALQIWLEETIGARPGLPLESTVGL